MKVPDVQTEIYSKKGHWLCVVSVVLNRAAPSFLYRNWNIIGVARCWGEERNFLGCIRVKVLHDGVDLIFSPEKAGTSNQ